MGFKFPLLKYLLTQLNVDQALVNEFTKSPFENHQLTFAETILVYEGIKNGVADCRISEKELELKQLEAYHQYICAELLERLLMPQFAKKLFGKTKLVIQGACIYRLADIVRIKAGKSIKENHALNLHDSIVDIDLTFKDCTFGGAINLQGARTQNLIFERPRLQVAINALNEETESFIGINLHVCGSLVFTQKNTDSYNADQSHPQIDLSRGARHERQASKKLLLAIEDNQQIVSKHKDFQFEGGVNLQHAKIDGRLEFYDININGYLKCDHLKVSRFIYNIDEEADDTGTYTPKNNIINGDINLTEAYCEKTINFLSIKVQGSIRGYHLRSGQFIISASSINGYIELIFAEIEHLLSFQDSEIIGFIDAMSDSNQCSIEAPGLTAGNIFFREGSRVANGINFYRCIVKDGIDFTHALITATYPNNEAINLNGSKIGTSIQFSSGSVIIGTLYLNDASIGGNIYFAGCKLITTYPRNYKKGDQVSKSVSAKNAYIGKSVFFSPTSKNLNKTVYQKLHYSGYSEKQILSEVPYPDTFKKNATEMKQQLARNSKQRLLKAIKTINNKRPRHLRTEDENTYINKKCEIFFNSIHCQETFLEESIRCYENAIAYLKLTAENENYIELKETEFAELMLETTISIGNISFTGIHVCGQIDISSALLYAMPGVKELPANKNHSPLLGMLKNLTKKQIHKKASDYPNALTMKFSNVEGELFLNEGIESNLEKVSRIDFFPFRACGEVNLHSSKIGQFFISPRRGSEENSKWKVIGVKYSYIYSNEPSHHKSLLEQCAWFYNYSEENNRQPYEELAAAYLRAGDDTKSRRVLLRATPRNGFEMAALYVLRGVSWLGIPHYKSLLWLLSLFLTGWIIFTQSGHTGGIVPLIKSASVEVVKSHPDGIIFFSGINYSFQHMLPFLNLGQKEVFSTTIYSGKNFFPDWVPLYADSGRFTSVYLFLHSSLSVLFLSMFVIGITRIIKRT